MGWDATPGHLHSKLRHLRATQFCSARINTPNENTALKVLQVPTVFRGTREKVGYTERDKMVAVFKELQHSRENVKYVKKKKDLMRD